MTKINAIEGIGEVYAANLVAAGVKTVEALLKEGASPKGREELAARAGVSHDKILEWVNRADLFRVKGVGEEYSDLLEAAGVDTVPELAQRNPEHLFEKLVATNEQKKLVRKLPTAEQVAGWVAQAKELPRLVTY